VEKVQGEQVSQEESSKIDYQIIQRKREIISAWNNNDQVSRG